MSPFLFFLHYFISNRFGVDIRKKELSSFFSTPKSVLSALFPTVRTT